MNRRAQLVALIAIAIAAVVFLVIVWPKLSALLKGAGAQTTCNFNLLLSALVKTGSLGLAEIPPGCEAEYITIGKEEIDARRNLANKRIKKYAGDTTGFYSYAARAFPSHYGVAPQAVIEEWALDSIMATELKDCWNKVWHGKLNLVKSYWGTEQRIFCIVCNVINFGEDLPASLRNRSIDSLYAWTKSEPYYQTTYYDFLQEGMTFKPTPSDFTFSTSTTTSIVYIESKKGWLVSALPMITYTVVSGATAILVVSGVGTPAGILGSILLGTLAGSSGAAVGIGAAAGTVAIQQALEKEAQTLGEAVKEKEVKAVGLAPYEGLGSLCTDIIA